MGQRALAPAGVVGLTLLMLAAADRTALAATQVSVALQDPSSGDAIPSMHIQATPNKVEAGRVVFTVKNESKGPCSRAAARASTRVGSAAI
jgi:uncharacterized cupredoxin-like copper-binding protein